MSCTRREFVKFTAATASIAGIASSLSAQQPPRVAGQAGRGGGPPQDPGPPPRPASESQVPKMKFFGTEVSRLVLGCNPFIGEGHFNASLRALMREYYTQERVVAVMHQAQRFGINAYNATGNGSAALQAFEAEGGKFHFIAQGGRGDVAAQVKALKPLAIYNMGETVDRAFQTGTMDEIREWCKKARDLGVVVGVGTHKPEVISLVEEQGWDVDFYAGCVYNRTRTDDEWRQVLNGELMEISREIYIQSDPPRMYKVMKQTKKPCFAFKVFAAGRIPADGAEQALRTAFESLKPIDGIFVGIFPKTQDEVRINAELACKILKKA
jgi:hypothetical protein